MKELLCYLPIGLERGEFAVSEQLLLDYSCGFSMEELYALAIGVMTNRCGYQYVVDTIDKTFDEHVPPDMYEEAFKLCIEIVSRVISALDYYFVATGFTLDVIDSVEIDLRFGKLTLKGKKYDSGL